MTEVINATGKDILLLCKGFPIRKKYIPKSSKNLNELDQNKQYIVIVRPEKYIQLNGKVPENVFLCTYLDEIEVDGLIQTADYCIFPFSY